MGFFARLMKRLGYVRLRDYNLRTTVDGRLAVINSQHPVPIDYGQPAAFVETPAVAATWPQIPQLEAPPAPPHAFAEGTADGVEPVRRLGPPPVPVASKPRRAPSDTIPQPLGPELNGD